MPLIPKQQPPYYEPGGLTIKTYAAIMTQTSTDAPTALILQNTIGDIIWTYNAPGIYTGTLTGQLPENKLLRYKPMNNLGSDEGGFYIELLKSNDNNTITIQCSDGDGNFADDLLLECSIKFEIHQ